VTVSLYRSKDTVQCCLVRQVQRSLCRKIDHRLEVGFHPRPLGQWSVPTGDDVGLQPPDGFYNSFEFGLVNQGEPGMVQPIEYAKAFIERGVRHIGG